MTSNILFDVGIRKNQFWQISRPHFIGNEIEPELHAIFRNTFFYKSFCASTSNKWGTRAVAVATPVASQRGHEICIVWSNVWKSQRPI